MRRRKAETAAFEGGTEAARPFVERLVDGGVPWDRLALSILSDTTLSDTGKVAALAQLHEHLGNANQTAATCSTRRSGKNGVRSKG